MGTWEHIKLGELPRHNAPSVFFLGNISLKIHIKIKRKLFTYIYTFFGECSNNKFIGLNITKKIPLISKRIYIYIFCKQGKRLIFCRPAHTFVPNILLLNLRNKLVVGLRQKNENFRANGPPKREREREQLHYSIKKKAHIHKGKGGGTQREDECPKSIESKVKTTPQKREGRKGTKRMDR
jgi:hypothetical protein